MKTNDLTAFVLGASGLVGTELVSQLLSDPDYSRVVTVGRRSTEHLHPKLTHHVVDFEKREEWTRLVRADAFFSSMGTTLKLAGTKEAQRRVDYDYQYQGMVAAKENGVRSVVLVSSTGADAQSSMFYLRMKGEVEEAVLALAVPSTTILRPGMLDGERKERRTGEKWGLKVARLVPSWRALSKIRPVHVSIVARAARAGAREGEGSRIWEAEDIFSQGE
jgi:uncharacterized protein YbjT (DUF2867 family)